MLRKRHPASDALLDLREALDKTQPELAAMMELSRSRVALWETSDPPRGETLLRLAQIAKQSAIGKHGPTLGKRLGEIESKFFGLYMEEIMANTPGQLTLIPETEIAYTHPLKLQGKAQIDHYRKMLATLPRSK